MNRTNWLNHINNPQLFEDEDKNYEFTNDLMQKLGKATNKTQLLEHKNKQLQARIDKAISYLEKCESMGIMGMLEQKYAYVNIPKVLEVLRGDDNE